MPVQDVQVRLCACYLLVFLVDSLLVFQGGKLKTQTLATYIDHQSCTCMIPPHSLWFPLFPEIFKGFSYVLEVSMVITANSVIHWMPRRMDGGWAVQLAMLQRSSAQRSMAVHWIPCESLRKVDGTRSCLWMFVELFSFFVCVTVNDTAFRKVVDNSIPWACEMRARPHPAEVTAQYPSGKYWCKCRNGTEVSIRWV